MHPWLVCEEVCIPEEGVLKLSLLVARDPPIADFRAGPIFAKARAARPKPSPWTAQYIFNGKKFRLDVAAPGLKREVIEDTWFYPYGHGVVKYAARQKLSVTDRGLTLEAQRGRATEPISSVGGLLVIKEKLVDGEMATQAFRLAATEANPAALIGFWEAVVLAVLGGLILNLMPCVLPVLAVKALGFASHANEGRGMGRHGAAYTLGVLASFAIVGAVLLAVRGGRRGGRLGLPASGACLRPAHGLADGPDRAEFRRSVRNRRAPRRDRQRPGRAIRPFRLLLHRRARGYRRDAVYGALHGRGGRLWLSQPAAVAMAVMLALGLGLALPFLLLSLATGLLRLVPKPGPWMVRFKQLLAFPMFANRSLADLGCCRCRPRCGPARRAGRGDPARLRGSGSGRPAPAPPRFWRPIGLSLAAVAVICRLCHGSVRRQRRAGSGERRRTRRNNRRRARLGAVQRSGADSAPRRRPAGLRQFHGGLVHHCIANEKVVLRLDSVGQAVKKARMTMLKGDWTRRDPVITKHLAAFGRSGVPLYVIYPPQGSAKKPMILPQILTEGHCDRPRSADGRRVRDGPGGRKLECAALQPWKTIQEARKDR